MTRSPDKLHLLTYLHALAVNKWTKYAAVYWDATPYHIIRSNNDHYTDAYKSPALMNNNEEIQQWGHCTLSHLIKAEERYLLFWQLFCSVRWHLNDVNQQQKLSYHRQTVRQSQRQCSPAAAATSSCTAVAVGL